MAPSSRKQTACEAGSDAPHVPRLDRQMPRVLFSSPECRVVVVDLGNGEEIGDHRVRERAVAEVTIGRVVIESSGETAECDAGTFVTFDPVEEHCVRALADARLLLVLAPWPAAEHDTEAEQRHGDHLPANAVVEPLPASDTAA
jgi:quercetin dioxygenase-like cupin family protein